MYLDELDFQVTSDFHLIYPVTVLRMMIQNHLNFSNSNDWNVVSFVSREQQHLWWLRLCDIQSLSETTGFYEKT